MNNATLTRNEYTDWGTFGVLKVKGVAFVIVELPWRDNKEKISCIPTGEYLCKFEYSDGFKRDLYEIKGVPGRSECKFHNGTWAGDRKKGYKSDSKGCPIIGQNKRLIDEQWGVNYSRVSLEKFHALMNGEDMMLTVKNKEGIEPCKTW